MEKNEGTLSVEMLRSLWPVEWVEQENAFVAIVRGITIKVWRGLLGNYLGDICLKKYFGTSPRELLVQLHEAVLIVHEQVVPEIAPEVSERSRIWKLVKTALAAGKWTYVDDDCRAYQESLVGTHSVCVSRGPYRIRMETQVGNHMLCTESVILSKEAAYHEVRGALQYATNQLMGLKL